MHIHYQIPLTGLYLHNERHNMKKFLFLSIISSVLSLSCATVSLANDEEIVIPGLNTAQTDSYLSFNRTSTGNVFLPNLDGKWYSTEDPFYINNSLQLYEGGMNALVYEDQTYSLAWQADQNKWRLVYGNVINQVGQGVGIDYNWTNEINTATEINTGTWFTDFTDITFSKSGTEYNVTYEEATPVVSAPAPMAGGGLIGLIFIALSILSRCRIGVITPIIILKILR